MEQLQIKVIVDKEHPEQVIEKYTFTIQYIDTEHGREVAGFQFDHSDGAWSQEYDAQEDLVALFLRLNDHCDTPTAELPGMFLPYYDFSMFSVPETDYVLQKNDTS